jgi:hypothetical protein
LEEPMRIPSLTVMRPTAVALALLLMAQHGHSQ